VIHSTASIAFSKVDKYIVNYEQPIEKHKINIHGIMPDYLFPTVDNFVDILEIKLPTFKVIEEDPNHKGSWVWSRESNHAIGQVITYLTKIERFRLEIERLVEQYHQKEILMVKPRAYILIGNSEDCSGEQKEGLKSSTIISMELKYFRLSVASS